MKVSAEEHRDPITNLVEKSENTQKLRTQETIVVFFLRRRFEKLF